MQSDTEERAMQYFPMSWLKKPFECHRNIRVTQGSNKGPYVVTVTNNILPLRIYQRGKAKRKE